MLPDDDRDPPATDELARMIYGDRADLIVAEASGVFELPDFEDLFDLEAQDRNAEGV